MTIPPPCGLGNSQRRRNHLARRRDRELNDYAAAQILVLHRLLLVAELHLIDVATDDAANDFLVQRAAHLRRTGDDIRRVRATATETASATAVARARAAATAFADCAEVTEA